MPNGGCCSVAGKQRHLPLRVRFVVPAEMLGLWEKLALSWARHNSLSCCWCHSLSLEHHDLCKRR